MDLAVEEETEKERPGWRINCNQENLNSTKVPSIGAMIGSKFGGLETNDRLSYVMTCLIGLPVEVHVKSGSIYSGIFDAKSNDKEFGVILKMDRLIKDGTLRGQKALAESVSKAPSKTLTILGSELVEVVAKLQRFLDWWFQEVAVTRDGLANDLQRHRQHELMLDSVISQSHHVEMGREPERWMPDEDDPRLPELDNIFDGPWHRLPNASDMEIFSMYGVGIPTDRACVYKSSPSTECYVPFKINTSAEDEDEDGCLNDGVYSVDGDETVPVLSAGFMCAKGWHGKTRFNPSGIQTYIREYDH